MGTNAPAPSGPDPIAEAIKPLEDAAKALGVLYTHLVKADPSDESCQVVSEMLKGLGAVKQRIVEGPPPAPEPMAPAPNSDPSAFDQAGMAMMGGEQGPPPGPPPGY